MSLRGWSLALCAAALLPLAACKTNGMGESVASAGRSAAGVAGSVPSLVNVDLSNVLNNLAVQLHLDRANVPINAQIPITIAANVCGVSINILSVSNGGGRANCTANTSSPELAQVVQQQLAAGGSVGGGAQGGSTAANQGAAGRAGAGTAGATGTGGTSSGATQTPAPATNPPAPQPAPPKPQRD
jgi:hypothetical protein